MTGRDPESDDGRGAAATVDASEFETATGESITRVLDLATWHAGTDLADLYARLERIVEEAVQREDGVRAAIRREIFPRISAPGRAMAPPNAGVFRARVEHIERVHRGLLFNGAVEACDGTSAIHDSLPVTIAQIGVCLVSYHGDQGSWVQRMYRRDVRMDGGDMVEQALEVLERRRLRTGVDVESRGDTLTDMARRGIMAYAERAALLHRATAPWRMGHGNPTPYELLTGSGMVELLERSLDLLHTLVMRHQRFVFVPSAPTRWLLTVANALQPLEYAIVGTQAEWMEGLLAGGYRGAWGGATLRRLREFVAETGPRLVVGAYRASGLAPAQLFYAHVEHAHEAALIALADSTLQEHRGFPLLIDLADTVCRGTFDTGSFNATTQLAYAQANAPGRYLAERQTRR